jgi:hypothetical protein
LYRQSQLWFKYLKTKRKQKSSGGHSPSLAGLYERLVDETKAKQQNRVVKKNQYKQQQQETIRDRKRDIREKLINNLTPKANALKRGNTFSRMQ